MGFLQLIRNVEPYTIFVLAMLLGAYLLNQLDRYTLSIVAAPVAQTIHFGDQGCLSDGADLPANSSLNCKSLKSVPAAVSQEYNVSLREYCSNYTAFAYLTNDTADYSSEPCKYDYNGQGSDYQILAGTFFILIYTFAGIPLGMLADVANRTVMLSIALLFWSIMTALTGFAQEYWHLVLLRLGLGLGEAGCTPMAISIITDYFPTELRGSAIGVYNWGIYTGYSMSYAMGNGIVKALNWRWVFYISGLLGIGLAPVIFFGVKEPKRNRNSTVPQQNVQQMPLVEKLKAVGLQLIRPAVLLLCIAGGVRNAGGYVWALNTENFFKDRGQTEEEINQWMSWIPLVGGSFGAVFGGFISDRVVTKRGLHARIWVLVISQVCAAPFAMGALLLPAPYMYLCLIPSNVIGEMWVGVTLTILVELVPTQLRTTMVGAYLFIISNIGGNMNLLVPILKPKLGGTPALKNPLLVLFPGLYFVSSVLFLLEVVVLRFDKQRRDSTADVSAPPNSDSQPLLDDGSTEKIEAGKPGKYSRTVQHS